MNCPCCKQPMHRKASAGGYAPEGFEYNPKTDDFYWCADCNEAYELDDPALKDDK